uniref:Uncharacterized protein n=1 Tax=Anguilla anguilla TaxID=7936 RepID=A0A0E9VS83_ANGAN
MFSNVRLRKRQHFSRRRHIAMAIHGTWQICVEQMKTKSNLAT